MPDLPDEPVLPDPLTPESAGKYGYFDLVSLCADTENAIIQTGPDQTEEQPVLIMTVGGLDYRRQVLVPISIVIRKAGVRSVVETLNAWLEDMGHVHATEEGFERRGTDERHR